MNSRLDRPQRDIESLGDLLVRQVLDLAEQQGQPPLGIEALEGVKGDTHDIDVGIKIVRRALEEVLESGSVGSRLIITADADEMAALEAVIHRLDIRRAQVLVEFLRQQSLVEVDSDDLAAARA